MTPKLKPLLKIPSLVVGGLSEPLNISKVANIPKSFSQIATNLSGSLVIGISFISTTHHYHLNLIKRSETCQVEHLLRASEADCSEKSLADENVLICKIFKDNWTKNIKC